jgi:hypothetical protein
LRESALDSYQQSIICLTRKLYCNFNAKQFSRKPWGNGLRWMLTCNSLHTTLVILIRVCVLLPQPAFFPTIKIELWTERRNEAQLDGRGEGRMEATILPGRELSP